MKKRRMVDDNLVPLKENILEKQEQLHEVKVECFIEVQKMEEKVKSLEKNLEIVSQINVKMESLHNEIEDLDRRRNMETSVTSGILAIKDYNIMLYISPLMSVKRWLPCLKKGLGRVW